jgi:general secretion pathway protein A
MYRQHWQLNSRPFAADFETRTYYPTQSHQGALLKLRYALDARHPGALLVGPAGSGKSLLVHLATAQAGETCQPWVRLVAPQLEPQELLSQLAQQLGASSEAAGQVRIPAIIERLRLNSSQGRHAVVVVEDAQWLAVPEGFELLRALLNHTSEGRATWTLLLVGQMALLPVLERLPGADDWLAVKCLLQPLTVDETASYIQHRLAAAEGRVDLFDGEAIERLHELSGGLPRRINRLADLALLAGFAEDRTRIDRELIESVATDLMLSGT